MEDRKVVIAITPGAILYVVVLILVGFVAWFAGAESGYYECQAEWAEEQIWKASDTST